MPGNWTLDHETRFVELLLEMADIVGRDLTSETIAAYRKRLGDIDGDMVVDGIDVCCRESRFWPTVAEVRDRAGANNAAKMQDRIEARTADTKLIAPAPTTTGIGDWGASS